MKLNFYETVKTMIAKKAEDRKQFMAMLLKDDVFDKFLVRSVSLRTNVTYEIDCAIDENWYDSEDRTELEKYAFWSEIRPVVFNLIKGQPSARIYENNTFRRPLSRGKNT